MERSSWESDSIDPMRGPAHEPAPQTDGQTIDVDALWSHLSIARAADELFASLQLPRYVSSRGEEAITAALALLLDPDDWVYPGTRDRVLPLLRGTTMLEMVEQLRQVPNAETLGRLSGTGTTSQMAAVATPTHALAMHLPLATGHARAVQLTQSNAVIVAICGEGLSVHGRFHEALSLAVSAHLPLVFVVKRPIWPKDPPPEAGVLGQGVRARALALGLWSQACDGADALAASQALQEAITRARQGQGPVLLEISYSPLYEDTELSRDPLHRMRACLQEQGRPADEPSQVQALRTAFAEACAKYPKETPGA